MNILKSLIKIVKIIASFGLDLRALFYAVRSIPRYLVNLAKILILSIKYKEFDISVNPQLVDRFLPGGSAKGHYFHQDLWAARKIFTARPKEHIDIGSRVDGFISHLLVFMDVTILDIRKIDSKVRGLRFEQRDLMCETENGNRRYLSISCLHALEHFGLGRYGDSINWDGWKDGLKSISNLLDDNGVLYLSVPIGAQRIEFDAHRVFNPDTIINFAKMNGLTLQTFSCIDDNGDFHENIDPFFVGVYNYGCGCFEFVRKKIAN